jgi:hypothetical protein
MASQEIQQMALSNHGDRALRHGDRVRREGTIVKHGDIGECSTRPEDFQNLFTTLY